MAVLSGASVPLLDVLLRILSGEMDVVIRLAHVMWASFAGMSIGYVKTA